MSLQSRLSDFIAAIGADIKQLKTASDQGLPKGVVASDIGYIDFNQDLLQLQAASTPTAGTLYLMRMVNRRSTSIVVSSVTVLVGTAGASLTNVGFALYSEAGALLTSSVNANGATATAFQSVNPRTVTFSTPQTIAAGAAYYVGFWFTGTTMPALYRSLGTNFVINFGTAAPTLRFATANTGLTNTPPANFGTQSQMPWATFCAVA